MPTIRKPFTHQRVRVDFPEPSLTKQSMKQETDINFIVQRYKKTGVVDHRAKYAGSYGEFQTIDFHAAMNAVAAANTMFEELPATIRKEFDNDPGRFVAFADDPANTDRMVELGLVAAVPPPPEPEPAPEPAPAPAPDPGPDPAPVPA